MDTRQAYDLWSRQYDTDDNKTRDLEGLAMRATLGHMSFTTCLEAGCGTGKNSEWLIKRCRELVAVDLSEGMLAFAREKYSSPGVRFVQADIRQDWSFVGGRVDLVTFSLVLEHVEVLDHVFKQAAIKLTPGGHVYVGELHPFKQYMGTKARFERNGNLQVVPCFNHHISDFTHAAVQNGFELVDINEHFDNDGRSIPRVLTLLFRKA